MPSFRFLWLWIAMRFQPRVAIMDEHRIVFRCWPHDMDINMHMTNSRYPSLCDLARGIAMMRTGGWKALRAAGLMPVVGSSTFRFRRPVNPFAKFTLTTRLTAWDDRWVYFEHTFVTDEGVATLGMAKLTFITRSGARPSSDEVMKMLGYDGPRPTFGPQHTAKEALDRALAA